MHVTPAGARRGLRAALLAVACFALVALGTGAGQAQGLSLVPIAQDFSPSGRAATQTFRLENGTEKQVAVTAKIMTREMSLDGVETNAETQDFLIFPEQALIAPRQSQVLRVQWRGPSNPPRELAYRIIAEQVPIKASLEPNARAIQLVVRYVGSLYVLPPRARANVVVDSSAVSVDAQNRRVLELVLYNKGMAHTLLDTPRLTISAGGRSATLTENDLRGLAGENILADTRRKFLVPWPESLPPESPRVEFKHAPLR